MQAVEAKHNLTIGFDSDTQATVTFQMFFRYYNKLAGMTVGVVPSPSPLTSLPPLAPACGLLHLYTVFFLRCMAIVTGGICKAYSACQHMH